MKGRGRRQVFHPHIFPGPLTRHSLSEWFTVPWEFLWGEGSAKKDGCPMTDVGHDSSGPFADMPALLMSSPQSLAGIHLKRGPDRLPTKNVGSDEGEADGFPITDVGNDGEGGTPDNHSRE